MHACYQEVAVLTDALGWRGSIRFDVQLVSPGAFPAVDSPEQPGVWPSGDKFYFLRLSETATIHATDQFEYEDIEARRDALVEEMMRRIAHHFGMDEFSV